MEVIGVITEFRLAEAQGGQKWDEIETKLRRK